MADDAILEMLKTIQLTLEALNHLELRLSLEVHKLQEEILKNKIAKR